MIPADAPHPRARAQTAGHSAKVTLPAEDTVNPYSPTLTAIKAPCLLFLSLPITIFTIFHHYLLL